MNKINYQKELEKIIDNIKKDSTETGIWHHPRLLLHSCCAPCSSYCMEYLREYFDITVFYYNPNISSEPEYRKRVEEEKRLIAIYNDQVRTYKENCLANGTETADTVMTFPGNMTVTANTHRIEIIEGDYYPGEFYDIAKGYESCPEGGERCFRCYELRLRKSFEIAEKIGTEYVTSTLTISPLKNAEKINEIGYRLQSSTDLSARWLPSDFKKKNGYKRSIELSHEFGLYRQNFCGCCYSFRGQEQLKEE